MGNRFWSKKELEYLEAHADRMTVESMSRAVGRTHDAVRIKMGKLGIRSFRTTMEYLSRNQIRHILGVDSRKIIGWHKNYHLRCWRIGSIWVAPQSDLVSFLKENQDLWNARQVRDDTIFMGEKWFEEKRRRDKIRKRGWTGAEIARMKMYLKKKMSTRSIAKKLDRSIGSVEYMRRILTNREREDKTLGITNEQTANEEIEITDEHTVGVRVIVHEQTAEGKIASTNK